MKLIKTIVRLTRVDLVREALAALNLEGITVSEPSRGGSHHQQVTIEVIVQDDLVGDAAQAILRCAGTTEMRHARVSVLPLDYEVEI